MGEETKNAKRAVPQAMMGAIIVNGILGLVMALTFVASPFFLLVVSDVCPILELLLTRKS